jgi:hypothetical protein
MRRGVFVERRLGEERNRVAEVVHVVDEAGIPIVEPAAVHGAGHVVLIQVRRHRRAEDVHPAVHQRVRIERHRVAERRNPDARREGRGLVMVVIHLG